MVTKFVLQVANAADLEHLWDIVLAKMSDYGIDRILYGSTRFRTEKSLGDPEDFLILTNYDRDYTDAFFSRGYYQNAPMVNWSLGNHGASSWNYAHRMYANGEMPYAQRAVYEFNQANGLHAGYSISFVPTRQRQSAGMGLVAANGTTQAEMDAIWAEHGDDILAMCHVAHLKIQTLPYKGLKRILTSRQREVLEWVGDGKTIQDISLLMDLKPATVEKHLRLAREALKVETTAQAILKASLQNQIFVLEMPKNPD